MSYDFSLDQTCAHYVSEEAVYVSPGRRIIRPKRPIAAENSVKVRLDGAIDVPSYGSQIPATMKGTKRGPFTVTSSATSLLRVKVSQGAWQDLVFPVSNAMDPRYAVTLFNQGLSGIKAALEDGTIRIETLDKGRQASLFIAQESTAASIFGFPVNREWRGQDLIPGWTLVTDLASVVEDRPTQRNIVFDYPLKQEQSVAEISYTTALQECRRCGGIGVENDWRYDVKGNPITVENEDLLLQELQKMVLTVRGSNPFHNWIGTSLVDAIGQKLGQQSVVQTLTLADITQAFKRFQSIKKGQEKVQEITDREFPYRLLGVNFTQHPTDPSILYIDLSVQNRSQQAIKLTRGLRLPHNLEIK